MSNCVSTNETLRVCPTRLHAIDMGAARVCLTSVSKRYSIGLTPARASNSRPTKDVAATVSSKANTFSCARARSAEMPTRGGPIPPSRLRITHQTGASTERTSIGKSTPSPLCASLVRIWRTVSDKFSAFKFPTKLPTVRFSVSNDRPGNTHLITLEIIRNMPKVMHIPLCIHVARI